MKRKTKLIASVMSICLVFAVFAIGVFALKTANLKIGGDVSFQATGVEAHIKNASVTGTNDKNSNSSILTEGTINTSMTQTKIDETFSTWKTLSLDFDENATDIVFSFDIANTSTNLGNYIGIDYDYSFSNANSNVKVVCEVQDGHILSPKGTATATYSKVTMTFSVEDKELNVPDDTKININISLEYQGVSEAVKQTGAYTNLEGTVYQEYYKSGDLLFSLNGNNATLIGYLNDPEHVEIPAVLQVGDGQSANYYLVSKIETAFIDASYVMNQTYSKALKTVIIPLSVNELGYGAFAYSSASDIVIPNSVKTLGYGAFGYSNILNVVIPDSVTTLGNAAFAFCPNLSSVTIGGGVTSFGESVFVCDEKLSSVVLKEGLTSIGWGTFMKCSSLISIYIPSTITSIRPYIFAYAGVGEIIVSPRNSVYDSRNNCNAIIETATNTLKFGCKNTIIPNSVKTIGKDAFSDCTGLTSIIIPDNVKIVDDSAFSGCTNLSSVALPNNLTNIGGSAFKGCQALTSITIPESVRTIGGEAFGHCYSLNEINFNAINCVNFDGMEFVFEFAGILADSLSVNFGNKVERIPSYFLCHGETKTLTIGDKTYEVDINLAPITIPNSVQFIGLKAFSSGFSCGSVCFKATNGWGYASDENAASWTSITGITSDFSANASLLWNTCSNYYMKKLG